MAGYEDTRQKIISTLMGRPNGTEIQPENHQDYALNMLDYIRSLELIATSTLIGVAESNTTPVQPDSSRVCYIAGVAQNQTVTFENFIGQDGNAISVTTGDMEGVFIILMWNTQHWSAQTFSTNIIIQAETITNLADGEDLTTIDNVIKFKDKIYESANYSGLARKYLRKNIVNGTNVLTQTIINEPNTIYHIQYDYKLNGATIYIPSNSVLLFEGGSFSNGVINGDDTLISGELTNVFRDVILSGNYKNFSANLFWWGAKRATIANQIDSTVAIENAFKSSIKIIEVSGTYFISRPIQLAYDKVIIGRTSNNNQNTGFYATDNFSAIDVTFPPRYGKSQFTQTVYGMFYHRDTTKSEMKDIFIDARFKSDFCIEHIDLYGSIDFYNCYLCGAREVGLLQYACENPIIQQLYITNCHIGMYMSTQRYNRTIPFDFTGEFMGMCNLSHFDTLKITSCNYGLIIRGGSNYNLNNLETDYNSIVGAFLSSSIFELTNYYVEGDGICNFWINKDGTKNTTGNRGITLPYLIENNLDGFKSRKDFEFNAEIYYRAPIVIDRAYVQFNSTFLSVKPRGNFDHDGTIISMPNIREDAGIDCYMIITKRSFVSGSNLNTYVLTNDIGKSPYKWLIDIASVNGGSMSKIDLNIIARVSEKPSVKIVSPWAIGSDSSLYCLNSKSYETFRSYIKINNASIYSLNDDIETKRYGFSYDLKDYRQNTFVETFKGIPLYKRTLTGANTVMFFTKEQFQNKFKDLSQVMVVCYLKILQDTTCRVQLDARFINNGNYVTGGQIDQGVPRLFYAGYYSYQLVVQTVLEPSLKWTQFQISFNDSENSPYLLFSDIFFYEVEEPDKKIYNYKSVFLPMGNTESRPINVPIGYIYYDTALNKNISWNRTNWVNLDGTILS